MTAAVSEVFSHDEMSADIDFDSYTEVFLNEKQVQLSPVTIRNYRRELVYASRVFGSMKMKEIGFLTVKGYFVDMQNNRRSETTGKPIAWQTLVQHYITLHSFFANAVENEVITDNPMRRLRRPKARKDEVQSGAIAYTEQELRYILKCLENEPLMWRALVMLTIDSGCRCGEIMGMKWSEMNLATGRVVICRNVQYTSERGAFVITPKNRKFREIFINTPIMEVLKKWKSEQDRIFADKRTDPNGFCFTRADGGLLIPNAFNSYLKRFGKKYGIAGIHPHALRHTMASLSIANGADIVSISRKLGHSNTSITLNIYSHANAEAQRRANEVFAKAVYS